MKIIYKSSDITEAHIVQGMLAANGIEAYVGGHYLQGGVGELLATDYASIYVADNDVPAATILIVEYENSAPDLDDNENEVVDNRAKQEVVTRANANAKMPGIIMVALAAFIIFVMYHMMKS